MSFRQSTPQELRKLLGRKAKLFGKKTLKKTKKGLAEEFHILVTDKKKVPRGFFPIAYFKHEDKLNEMLYYKRMLREAQEDRRALQRSLRFVQSKTFYSKGYIAEVKRRLQKAKEHEQKVKGRFKSAKARLAKAVRT